MSFVPAATAAHNPVYNDVISNNPCGVKKLNSVGGVDVSAQNLCVCHYAMQYGQAALSGALVLEP